MEASNPCAAALPASFGRSHAVAPGIPKPPGNICSSQSKLSLVSRFKGVPTRSGLKHCSGLGTDKLWRAGVLGAGHSCCSRSNLRVVANGQVNDSVLAGTRMGPVCWSA